MTPKRQTKKQVMMMSMVFLVGVTAVHTAVDTGRVVHCTYSVQVQRIGQIPFPTLCSVSINIIHI